MYSVMSWVGDPKFFTNYLFGLVIIVLYAKDKFNTPTYDKESMGPFSQLPPQLLTIDARYRQGMRTYVALLLALYTALCIIGPSTFSEQNVQFGFTSDTKQLWPVAAATFLISTGAAKDSSILGKIEHFIRQYAHKAAYIPSIVSNLAYAIRNVETAPWLKENKYKLRQDEFEERKNALTVLIGPKFVAKLNKNPRQQGHLATWARANIVFYCLQQMFRGVLPSEKLSQITDLPENVAILERLKKERDELESRFVSAEEQREKKSGPGAEVDLDKLLSDVQRFAKEVSLTIVVLLSQAVRTFSDLKERLEQLGFREIELGDHSDHLVYLVMVNFSILLGAFMSYALLVVVGALPNSFAALRYIKSFVILPQPSPSNDFSVTNHARELLIIATGALIYMVVFKVIDYLRESSLELSEWRENLQGYVMVVVTASLCSSVICILLMVLLLSPLELLGQIWGDLAGLAQQFLFQFFIAGLAAAFAVSYLRHAVQLQWRYGGQENWPRILLQSFVLFRELPDYIKLMHAVLAACLVWALTHASFVHNKNKVVDAAKADLERVQQSFNQNQGWLRAPQPSQTALGGDGLAPTKVGDPRIEPQVLIDISCKLRQMYASIHGFNVETHKFQLNPDLSKSVTGEAANKEPNSTLNPNCPALEAQNSNIEREIDQLKWICAKLNTVGLVEPSVDGVPSSAQQPSGASQAPLLRMAILPSVFKAPERCELNSVPTNDPNQQNFLGLGNSLAELFKRLDGLQRFSGNPGNHAAIVFPMIVAFFLAYMFGAGCRVWRAWWLNNEAGQQEIDKLKAEIESIYGAGVNRDRFEKWLTSPLQFLNNVAPKEAVRYEGLKARLYAKIESDQVDLRSVLVDRPKLLEAPA